MGPGATALRRMRIVHGIMFLWILVDAWLAERFAQNASEFSIAFLKVIVIACAGDVLVAYYFRRKKVLPALEKLRRDPNDGGALKLWREGTIVVAVLAVSVALFGFVLRFMGAGRRFSWPFFLVGLVLMLIWRPQLDLSDDIQQT